mmetsp:Transcript_8407/g.24796  ORF Transcript_8407/g.24796 Transcript_8407/m.24796 type:complete len:213 (-) Transcript_8407:409-1047(-)
MRRQVAFALGFNGGAILISTDRPRTPPLSPAQLRSLSGGGGGGGGGGALPDGRARVGRRCIAAVKGPLAPRVAPVGAAVGNHPDGFGVGRAPPPLDRRHAAVRRRPPPRSLLGRCGRRGGCARGAAPTAAAAAALLRAAPLRAVEANPRRRAAGVAAGPRRDGLLLLHRLARPRRYRGGSPHRDGGLPARHLDLHPRAHRHRDRQLGGRPRL